MTEGRTNPVAWLYCKLQWFLLFTLEPLSSAILVIMSAEKYFALYYPVKAKIVCKVTIAKHVSFWAFLIFFCFGAQWLFIAEATLDRFGYSICQMVNVGTVYKKAFYIFYPILYSYLSITLMSIFNSAIIAKLHCSHNRSAQFMGKLSRQGTVMVLTVTCVFIVLTLPAKLYFSIVGETYRDHPIAFAITVPVQSTNHGINALLYLFSGSKYRECVKKVLPCKSNVVSSPSQMPNLNPNLHTLSLRPMV